jgi:hypothetical protein
MTIFGLHDGLDGPMQVLAMTALPVGRGSLRLGDVVDKIFIVDELGLALNLGSLEPGSTFS